ncbi:translation initiation factor eIF-2B subunit epsilon [[Candida] anglica]|uniref:Translation initiation factor eIF2B subunit epsilon n=1 Tax=[Candida] anglica TaxID=148631 RepID=A0ABP0E7C1_9ASCO
MPPKNKKQKEIVQDERFQAIVLTDSFETRFMPLTSIKPRCLLPLANVPLIEYTLEFLAKAGVNEVFLMCSSHADQISDYIDKSKWSSKNSPFKVTSIMSLESRSVGDSMRDLDNRGLITGDFLLVSGDVVTNIDFAKAMSVHKTKRSLDKDHIVTMVLTPASPLHRTRSYADPATFILDTKTNRCLYYQNIPPVDGKKTGISIDPELLEDLEDEMLIRNDLIDCHVDICSPHVPQIFQENFDYQYLRSDFVKGVLTSDLLKKTIYAYIIESDEYAARVESWATYDAISQDILARWCYPLVPDSNLLDSQSFKYEFNHIYKEDKVVLAQSCKIGTCTSIGAETNVGEGSSIKKSVIGRNCVIGENVRITNSYIWDNVTIGDNIVIDHAIVASNAKIGTGAKINAGAVIGFNVEIGENKVIAYNTRIVEMPIEKDGDDFNNSSSFESSDDEDDQDGEFKEDQDVERVVPSFEVKDIDLVGEDGIGFLYNSENEFDDDSDSEYGGSSNQYSGMIYQMKSLNLSDDSIASATNYNRAKKHARHTSKSRRLSSTSVVSTDFEGAYSEEEEDDFEKEAVATVERAMEHNHDIDTALLELNTLRMSINVTYHEVRMATTQALLTRVVHFISTGTLDVKEAVNKIFRAWGALYKRQVFEPEEEVDLLQILQNKCLLLDPSYNSKILFFAINILYDEEVVDEDNIYIWWDSAASSATQELESVRELTGKWIEWLKDAEEESDEDSD